LIEPLCPEVDVSNVSGPFRTVVVPGYPVPFGGIRFALVADQLNVVLEGGAWGIVQHFR